MSKALIANAEYSLILKKILILMQKQNSAEILAEEYIFKLIITMPIFFISVCLSFKEIGHHSIKPFQCPYGRHYILEGIDISPLAFFEYIQRAQRILYTQAAININSCWDCCWGGGTGRLGFQMFLQ